MNLNTEKYWRNGEVISAQELNKIELGLLYLDNKITSQPQISNSGQQYQTFIDDVISTNIVYSSIANQSIVYFTPNYNPIGILTVADSNQSYTNINYIQGNSYVVVNEVDLSNSTIYVSYFYTQSNISFNQVVSNISYNNAIYPAMYVIQYTNINNEYGFNIYEYSVSSVNSNYYNPDGTLLGTYFFSEDSSVINVNQNNLSFTLITQEQLSSLSNTSISVGDIFYFTLVVPEPQSFGGYINALGGINVSNAIYPATNNVDLGTQGSLVWNQNTSQYEGTFKQQFRNIYGLNIYSDNIYTNQILQNQINNIVYKRLLLNNITGVITTDNKDLYIKLDQYNQEYNTGVQFKVGRQNNFSTNIDLTTLVNSIDTTNLQNLNLPVETITTSNNTTMQRLGYFTNIPNTGDVVYLNKSAIIDYMTTKNLQLQFNSNSYNYQNITQTYIDSTEQSVTITLTISNYIQSINSNNVEYYEFLIYNNKNTPYFSSGSINNFTSATFQFTSFIINLTNMNANNSEITVNGLSGNTNISLYQWNITTNQPSASNLVNLNIIDYDSGTIQITPVNTNVLTQLDNLQSISFIYPLYKLSVKNSQLDIGTTLGELQIGTNIGFVKNGYLEPLVTYIDSGVLNFTPSSSSQTINLNQNVDMKDIEIILAPLKWNYVVTPQGSYEMSLTYQKLQNTINVQFLINQSITDLLYSTQNFNVNSILYTEKLNTVVTNANNSDCVGLQLQGSSTPCTAPTVSQCNVITQGICKNGAVIIAWNNWPQTGSFTGNGWYNCPWTTTTYLYRSTDQVNWTLVATVYDGLGYYATYFEDHSAPAGTCYYYVNAAGIGNTPVISIEVSQSSTQMTTTTITTSPTDNIGLYIDGINNLLRIPEDDIPSSLNYNSLVGQVWQQYNDTQSFNINVKSYMGKVNVQSSITSNPPQINGLNWYQAGYGINTSGSPIMEFTDYFPPQLNGSDITDSSQQWVVVPFNLTLSEAFTNDIKLNQVVNSNNINFTINVQAYNTITSSIQTPIITLYQSTDGVNFTQINSGQQSGSNTTWTYNYTLLDLNKGTYYFYATVTATSVSDAGNSQTAQVAINTNLVQNPTLSQTISNNNVQSNVTVPYSIVLKGGNSTYNLSISYNNNGQGTTNAYDWTTDINGNSLTNLSGNDTINMQMKLSTVNTTETIQQSITITATDANTNSQVATYTLYFNYTNAYMPPVLQPTIQITPNWSNNIVQNKYYTYNISVTNIPSGQTIKIQYNQNNISSYNKYGWTTDINGNPLTISGSNTTFTLPIELLWSNPPTTNSSFSQSITANLINSSGNTVASNTCQFTFQSVYVQSVIKYNNIVISGLSGTTISEGNYTTYGLTVVGDINGSYYIKVTYNPGSDSTQSNSYSWNNTTAEQNLSIPFQYINDASMSFTMPIKLVDQNNENAAYTQSITATLYDATTSQAISQTSATFTLQTIYVQPPQPTPVQPTGNFTLAAASILNGNSSNTINYNSTYSTGNTIYVYFLINGVASNTYKTTATITPGSSGTLSLLTPQNMTGVTGIQGQLTQNTGNLGSVTPIATYTIPSSAFTIQQSIAPTISLTLGSSSVISSNPFNLSWTAKASGIYSVYIDVIDSDQSDIIKFITGQSTYLGQTSNSMATESLSITLGGITPKQITITQSMRNTTNGSTLQTSSQVITINPQTLPYTINSTVSSNELIINSSNSNSIYVTINATAPSSAQVKVTLSSNGGIGSQSISYNTYTFNNNYSNTISIPSTSFLQIIPAGYDVTSGAYIININCTLTDSLGNVKQSSGNTISVYYNQTQNLLKLGQQPTQLQYLNSASVGSQLNQNSINQIANVQIENGNSNTITAFYINGNQISLTYANNNYSPTIGNIQQYLLVGYNEISFQLSAVQQNTTSVSLVINSGSNILQNNKLYVQADTNIQQQAQIPCYQYTITGTIPFSQTSFVPTKLTLMSINSNPTTHNTYQYIGNYTQSQPLTISLPALSNSYITSATINYGTNTNSLKQYTHSYTNNKNSYNISIYSSSNPTNSTSSSPYNITMYISWGDGSNTNITTAQTQSDVGTFNIGSINIQYLTIDNNYESIPINGTVKYLILGKTL